MAEYDPRLDPDALLTTAETAALVNLSKIKLEKDRAAGVGLPYVRLGYNTIRYRRRDVLAHIDAHAVRPSPYPSGPLSQAKQAAGA